MPKTAHRSDSSCQKQTRDLAVARSSRSSSKLKLKRNDAPKKAGHSRKTYSRLLWIPSCLLLTPVAPARNPFSSPLSSPLVNERRLPSLVHTFYAATASMPTFPSPSHPVALCPAPRPFPELLTHMAPCFFTCSRYPYCPYFMVVQKPPSGRRFGFFEAASNCCFCFFLVVFYVARVWRGRNIARVAHTSRSSRDLKWNAWVRLQRHDGTDSPMTWRGVRSVQAYVPMATNDNRPWASTAGKEGGANNV